ncbi:hypothetical protein G5V57_02820 [Nordella sp. HKS 07]|uniref:hypothetical protein n=1 Tax=Nordella sp. HKS 07 TaxID=2712222 RepID=UPI0013E136CA|nr:hypothetical protein [Nordella sp. HKS 07]QIG46776.1 hypothetical protein G5V57_02820 [Nordella sp. HKS 07]
MGLSKFPAQLRRHIADRLNYISVNDIVVIPTERRYDHSPSHYILAPNSSGITVRDPADLAASATETHRMDAKGFCNPPAKAERPSVDIVVLGDSFVFCSGVEATDTSTSYLEEISYLTTYNISIGRIGPYEYVELLRHFGLALKPRVVILNIYEGNDLRDALRYEEFRLFGQDRRAAESALEDALSYSYALSLVYASGEWLLRDQISWLLDSDRNIDYHYTASSQGALMPLNESNRGRTAHAFSRQCASDTLWSPGVGDGMGIRCREGSRRHGDKCGRVNRQLPHPLERPCNHQAFCRR